MPDHPCFDCGMPVYVPSKEYPPGEGRVSRILCSKHYVPVKPTRGWLLSKARKLSKFDFIHYSNLSSDSERDKYLIKILDFKSNQEIGDEGKMDHER